MVVFLIIMRGMENFLFYFKIDYMLALKPMQSKQFFSSVKFYYL